MTYHFFLLTFSEAEYTFQQKKPILPLIMQRHYKPDGWLGIILGAKLYINMERFPFEEAYAMMVKELIRLLGAQKVYLIILGIYLYVWEWNQWIVCVLCLFVIIGMEYVNFCTY